MVLGDVLQVQASGTFRNQNGAQNLRLRLYAGVNVIWDTGVFTMPTLTTFRPWNVRVSVRMGPTLVANGGFSYRSGTNTLSGFEAETSTAFPGGILQLSVQWGSANVNNSLVCRRLTISRLY
jgi:hypothetical protein